MRLKNRYDASVTSSLKFYDNNDRWCAEITD